MKAFLPDEFECDLSVDHKGKYSMCEWKRQNSKVLFKKYAITCIVVWLCCDNYMVYAKD